MADTTRAPRSVIVAFALLTLLVIGWCIYWFSFRAKLQNDVAEFRATLTGIGLQLDCTNEAWGGFPFRYELTCQKPNLHGSYEGRPLELHSEQLRLYMQAYNPFHILALADGPTILNGNRMSHDLARSSLRYDTQGNWDAAAELPKADIAGAATAMMLKLFARVQDGKLQLATDAQGLQAPAVKLPPLSATLTAETDAAVLAEPDPLAFAAASGTALSITHMTATTGNVTMDGTGLLSLDSTGRLNGKLSTNVSDLAALLALLTVPLNLSPEEVTGAQAVIGLLGGNQPGKPTKLDLIAKDGELYFGPFKLADVPPLR